MRNAVREVVGTIFNMGEMDFFRIVFSIILSVLISLIISQVYKHTHRGMNYELSFMSTLVLLAPIVTLVMLFIRGDLVLSLGLIGSLSIIRFRTPIKDTRDMVFLFWTIAVGLGAGTYNWMVVIISSFIMVPLVFFLYFVRYGRASHVDFVLVIAGDTSCIPSTIDTVIRRYSKNAKVRSHEIQNGIREIVYEISISQIKASTATAMVDEVNHLDGINRTSLLAPQLNLPV
mgnify:CR=1 FL=1|jgi:hypothetical protein